MKIKGKVGMLIDYSSLQMLYKSNDRIRVGKESTRVLIRGGKWRVEGFPTECWVFSFYLGGGDTNGGSCSKGRWMGGVSRFLYMMFVVFKREWRKVSLLGEMSTRCQKWTLCEPDANPMPVNNWQRVLISPSNDTFRHSRLVSKKVTDSFHEVSIFWWMKLIQDGARIILLTSIGLLIHSPPHSLTYLLTYTIYMLTHSHILTCLLIQLFTHLLM